MTKKPQAVKGHTLEMKPLVPKQLSLSGLKKDGKSFYINHLPETYSEYDLKALVVMATLTPVCQLKAGDDGQVAIELERAVGE